MATLRSTNGYDQLSDAKLIETSYFIYGQVSTRTALFPNPMPTMTAMKTAIDNYKSALNLALTGDRIRASQKNQCRQTVIDMLHQLSHYVLMIANGDRQIAVESGIPLAKEATSVILDKPTNVKADYTSQHGELLLSVKKLKGAKAYMYQHSTDPLLKQESWMITNSTSSKCKITGLTPGTTYFIRVGVVGTKEQVLYSDVISKMAA